MSDMDFELPSDSEEEVPDWLKGLGGQDPPPDAGASQEETPDGLIEPESSQETPLEIPSQEDESIPDWMAAGDAQEAADSPAPSEEAEDVPDWLTNIRDSEAPDLESAPAEDVEGEENTEWLDQIRQREEERIADESSQPPDEANFMDRIQSLEASEEAVADDAQEQQAPDWLAGLQADQEPAQSEAEESPDWLSGLVDDSPASSSDAAPAISEPEAALPPASNDDPISGEDLSDLREDRDSAAEGVDTEFPDLPKDSGFVDTGSLPSWLVDMKRTGSLEETDQPTATPAFPSEEDALPTDEAEESFDLDLTPGDLPDWISEPDSDMAQTDETLTDNQPKDSGPIAPADMPNWLHSMRPVESPYASGEESDGVEETVGPLAGLQDVIPAEPEIVQFGKPPAFSLTLEVTDNQQYNASILERMLAADNQTQESKGGAMALTQGALRWAIAGLLIVSLLVPILLPESINFSLPTAIPPDETLRLQNLVSDLDQEATVLVAFDYQPGLSGEIHAAADAVFDHLLLRGAQLALVSTQPTGPALAESFLSQTQAAQHRYITEHEYCNMGYLSGGTSALLSLAENPRTTLPVAICRGIPEKNPWNLPLLQNINALSDFDMLIVLTDDANSARAWIEQVQPALGDTPLTMIISAQAEPLVRPYFQSDPKQVAGFVAGVLGGAYYESSIGRDHIRTARLYWNSYSVGLGVAVFIILFGSLANLASSLLSRRKSSSSKGQA